MANGFFHVSFTLSRQRYSPGTVTGVLLYVPLGLGSIALVVSQGQATLPQLAAAVYLGILGSAIPFFHGWRMVRRRAAAAGHRL
jgi:hypothetical protein